MLNFAMLKDVVLFALAIYAAVLSTFNLIQSIKKDRRSIKVTMNSIIPTFGAQLGPTFVQLKAVNSGHRPVSVTLLTIQLPDGRRLMSFNRDNSHRMPESTLPAKLSEGEFANCYFSYQDVAHALLSHGYNGVTKLTPVCEDSIGATHRGKAWGVNPQEWAGM